MFAAAIDFNTVITVVLSFGTIGAALGLLERFLGRS